MWDKKKNCFPYDHLFGFNDDDDDDDHDDDDDDDELFLWNSWLWLVGPNRFTG